MATTLTNLRGKVRRRADMVSSQFVTDADLTDFINDAYAEVYGIYASSGQDWLMADPVSKTITSGNTIDLTASSLGARMHRFRGIDFSTGGDWVPLRPFDFAMRGIWQGSAGSVTGTYRIWYVPEVTDLSNDADELNAALSSRDVEEYIVCVAAAAALAKAERDTSAQERRAAGLMRRIEKHATTRGQPKAISDDDGEALPSRYTARNDRVYMLRGSKVEIQTGWWSP